VAEAPARTTPGDAADGLYAADLGDFDPQAAFQRVGARRDSPDAEEQFVVLPPGQ